MELGIDDVTGDDGRDEDAAASDDVGSCAIDLAFMLNLERPFSADLVRGGGG